MLWCCVFEWLVLSPDLATSQSRSDYSYINKTIRQVFLYEIHFKKLIPYIDTSGEFSNDMVMANTWMTDGCMEETYWKLQNCHCFWRAYLYCKYCSGCSLVFVVVVSLPVSTYLCLPPHHHEERFVRACRMRRSVYLREHVDSFFTSVVRILSTVRRGTGTHHSITASIGSAKVHHPRLDGFWGFVLVQWQHVVLESL